MEVTVLNETIITNAIIDRYFEKLRNATDLDVAIIGGGPSGLVAGYYISKAGKKAALFEKKLSIGGGLWGGGMMFNEIVLQDSILPIIEEFELKVQEYKKGYYVANSIDVVATLIKKAISAGLNIFNLINVEDLIFKKNRVAGIVINWSPVNMANLHIDPLSFYSKYVIDATGHAAEIVTILTRKMGVKLNTETGQIIGEKSMDATQGETQTVENTKEVYPGLFVSGMAANAVLGGYRMGPIFGGMFLSGKKVAEQILEKLK